LCNGKITLGSLYMTEFQPYPYSRPEGRESATSTVNVAETDGECCILERHSFSEQVALAGELLHIPWRVSTFMTTDSLL